MISWTPYPTTELIWSSGIATCTNHQMARSLFKLCLSPPPTSQPHHSISLHLVSPNTRARASSVSPDSRNRSFRRTSTAMMSRRRGGGLRIKKKARGFMCGCGGSKAVSISDGSEKSPMATPPTAVSSTPTTMSFTTTTTTATTTTKASKRAGKSKAAAATAAAETQTHSSSFSPSSYYAETDDAQSSMEESTPSLSALLRQLRDLERSVRFLHAAAPADCDAAAVKNDNGGGGGSRRHRRTASEGGGGGGRVEESVAVVKESADPLADFRRSMLQMIVEKEIVGGAELRELLHRFLSLNAPHHHHLILRAFAEIWEEVFAGYDRTPDLLAAHRQNNQQQQQQLHATARA
ncbi:hypothetical protein EJB05_23612 [Eragrostis curvula]|uniref:Transcription repressor n=1 Tax=Eragrostis curvula TaxID=38414 RepID=A0A5J9V8Z2_9POAL|nr:hypothetical protein EJB05_23612 [Eragrostis curvula]